MTTTFDVIVLGSGPAGVSAAFPLVEAGLRVLMLDGGRQPSISPPSRPFNSWRAEDGSQWKWVVGEDFYALQRSGAVSPKLRVPTHRDVFDHFAETNKIVAEDFVAVGSLATGGLSNAWGCGVARLSEAELAEFPCSVSELNQSYEIVARRIGISGRNADDLADYFGLDAWSQPPVEMDTLHRYLFEQYTDRSARVTPLGFRLGRSRVAVLSEDHGGRSSCNNSGNCLWGCHRKALYSASDELRSLRVHDNFQEAHGIVVEGIVRNKGLWSVQGCSKDGREQRSFAARKVVLATGTLATTRFVLQALKYERRVRVLSCPTAAFLLWLPRFLGAPRVPAFGLGQLSFSLSLPHADTKAFGSTFSTAAIPVSEFVRHLPLNRRYGIDLLKGLLSSCLVGNVFLPGALSTSEARLMQDGALSVSGGHNDRVVDIMADTTKRLREAYRQLGALMLPGSFTIGRPGGDIHYAGTLPMRREPSLGETNFLGEPRGLEGVHVVDGACLPSLSEKSHTLTIMANADRIGRSVAVQMQKNNKGETQ